MRPRPRRQDDHARRCIRAWLQAAAACLAASVLAAAPAAAAEARTTRSLVGRWQFAIDPKDEGTAARWFAKDLGETIELPGTTEERGKGPLNEDSDPLRLTRLRPYTGAAWYARSIVVPADWRDRQVLLRLERTKLSRLWIDGRLVGERDSLTAPHEYSLGTLAAGPHRITLRIDNKQLPPLGDPHQWSDHTQTNWNGVVGRIELVAQDPVAIERVAVFPEVKTRSARVRVTVANASGQAVAGEITLSLAPQGPRRSEAEARARCLPRRVASEGTSRARSLSEPTRPCGTSSRRRCTRSPSRCRPAPASAPAVIARTCASACASSGPRARSSRSTAGRPSCAASHDACVFPLTGYAPMDVASWTRVFETAKPLRAQPLPLPHLVPARGRLRGRRPARHLSPARAAELGRLRQAGARRLPARRGRAAAARVRQPPVVRDVLARQRAGR